MEQAPPTCPCLQVTASGMVSIRAHVLGANKQLSELRFPLSYNLNVLQLPASTTAGFSFIKSDGWFSNTFNASLHSKKHNVYISLMAVPLVYKP